jgi:hypothetical protein
MNLFVEFLDDLRIVWYNFREDVLQIGEHRLEEITNYKNPERYDLSNLPGPKYPNDRKNLEHLIGADCLCICCK